MKSMRGPPGKAIRIPTNVPSAFVTSWLQLPLAISSAVLSACNCHLFRLQGRRSTVPVTAVLPADPLTTPSMQSASPIRKPVPETPEALCEIVACQ